MHIRNMGIGLRLAMGFGALLSILLVMLIVVIVSLVDNRNRWSEGQGVANAKVNLTNTMQSAVLEGAVAIRNIGLHKEVNPMKAEEKKILAERKRYLEARDKFIALGMNANESSVLERITKLDAALEEPLRQAIAKALADGRAAVAASMGAGSIGTAVEDNDSAARAIMTRIDPMNRQALAEIASLVQEQQSASQALLDNMIAGTNRLLVTMVAIGAAALVLGVLFSWTLTRSITRPLKEAVVVAKKVASGDLSSQIKVLGADEVGELLQALNEMNSSLTNTVGHVRAGTEAISHASQQIAYGSADLSNRSELQASSLQQTANSMEQLTNTVRQNADNAQIANRLVGTASEVAVKGGGVVSRVIDTMGSIKQSSRKVVDIIGVIDSIAFQTNILALNAAVEAAGAGEHGRGFAVVAGEVRTLAKRAAAAAKEIKGLIDDSVTQVELGSGLVDDAGQTMREIVTSVQSVADIMREIGEASAQQSTGLGQLNGAIANMDRMTQQSTTLFHEAATSAQSMRDQSLRLSQLVSTFKLAADGE